MNTKTISVWIALFFSMLYSAQNITLVSSTDITHTGLGNPVVSTPINIGSGKNRVVIAYYFFERDHRPGTSTATFNDNKPVNGISTSYFTTLPTVNSNSMVGRSSSWADYIYSASQNYIRFSGYSQQYIYAIPDGVTGTVPFNHNITNAAQNIADDVIIKVAVFENVSSKSVTDNFPTSFASTYGIVAASNINTSNLNLINIPVTVGTPTIGRNSSEIYYYGVGASVRQESLTLTSTGGWQQLTATNLANPAGSAFNNGTDGESGSATDPASLAINHESDGLTMNSLGITGVSSPPNLVITRNDSKYVPFMRFHGITLLPVAKPSIAGSIFRDTDGPTNINGTKTNLAAKYVNLVDSSGNLVYSAAVTSSGDYLIPTGYATEGFTYTLQLSNMTGVNGLPAPPRVLSAGYATVGEAAGTTLGNDGQADGSITVSPLLVDLSDYNFGVSVCKAGSLAPNIKNLSFACPATFTNLSSSHLGVAPPNSTIVWFTNNTHTGTALTATQVSQATPGTYYAFYYDSVASCYSPASNPIIVKLICATNDSYNVNATQAIAGVPTIGNVLTNDIYNTGSSTTATISNVNITVVTPATSIGGAPTPTLDITTGNINIPAGIATGNYTITYQICDKLDPGICSAATVTIVVANVYCYKTPIIALGTKIPTKQGITALDRAGSTDTAWPIVRQSAWMVLEAKTKGFVINRVQFDSLGQPVGIIQANYVEGMMVYDTTNNCLKIYNGTIWSCYTTPACP